MGRYIDLHLHLDGAISPHIARRLAGLQDMPLPSTDDELARALSVPETCSSLNDFLRCFDLPVSLLQTPGSVEEAVRLVADEAASHGAIYVEIRFAPQLHCRQGMTQDEAVTAAERGARAASIPVNLILCLMRGASEETNSETVDVALGHVVETGGVVALDLAGAEALYPTEAYAGLFGRARREGIPFTIHAGEAAGPESVRAALAMGAFRIGHGVRASQDPILVDELAKAGVPLEVCPTSNLMTRAVESAASHPLVPFLERGIVVTVNTDDPAIELTTIDNEFAYCREILGMGAEQERLCLSNAVEAAFTTQKMKAELLAQLGL